MAGIRSVNTRPELLLRRSLHRLGFRYRLHSKNLPGRPDMVFPAYNAAVFVHGCFWHRHSCRYFKMPTTRRAFWAQKFVQNRKRDAVVQKKLRRAGWRQLVIWECAVRGKDPVAIEKVIRRVVRWLESSKSYSEMGDACGTR